MSNWLHFPSLLHPLISYLTRLGCADISDSPVVLGVKRITTERKILNCMLHVIIPIAQGKSSQRLEPFEDFLCGSSSGSFLDLLPTISYYSEIAFLLLHI